MRFILIIFLMSLALDIDAQTSVSGASEFGSVQKTTDPVLSSFGVLDAYDARYGITMNAGSTNVFRWSGIQGSSHSWVNYVTNTPVFLQTVTTNNLPAVHFQLGVSNLLRCDSLAPAINTSQGFTIMILICPTSSGVAMTPFSLGWTGNTNGNASTFRINPGLGTPTSGGVGLTFNTNSQFGNYTLYTGGANTNSYFWFMGGYSNNQVFAMNNLTGSQTQLSGTGTFTVDRALLGGRMDGNGTPDRYTQKGSGYISMVVTLTNFLEGASRTNLFWYLNTNYSSSYYRVVTP